MVRFLFLPEQAAQELLERRLRRVAFALHGRVAVAVRAALLDPLVEEAWNAHVLSLFEGVHGLGERRIIVRDRALGNSDDRTLAAANNLVSQLQKQRKHAEAVTILREPLSEARRAFGDDHEITLMLGSLLADSLVGAGTNPTVDDVREAIAIREDICRRSRRLLGVSHPHTEKRQRALDSARLYLARHFPEEG